MASLGYSIIGIAKALGVSRETFKRWCGAEEELQEAFEIGRETQRQALIALIVQAAVANRGANANAMFLLKTLHGFREFDSPHAKVDVSVAVQSVLVVKDHGDNATWAAKMAEQQRRLIADNGHQPQLEASTPPQSGAVVSFAPADDLPAVYAPVNAPAAVPVAAVPHYGPPVWRGRA
jgi:AcrR family transcriptional regulator